MRPRFRYGALLSALLIAFAGARAQQAPLEKAQALLKTGRPRDALTILLELDRSAPPDANRAQMIGVAYTQLESFADAEKYYREAVRLNPRFWAARKNLATMLWFLDRKPESEREFLAVTGALPTDPVPHLYLGLAAHARRDYTGAKLQFEKAGALASENPEVLPAVVESHLAARDAALPAKVAQQLATGADPDPALLSRIGALLLQYGAYAGAATVLERLTSIQPASAEAWRMLGEAYGGVNKPEQAYGAYSRAIDADPRSPDAYIALAEFASAHKNNDFAVQVIGRGLELEPQSPELLFERALLFAIQGDRGRAEADFVQVSQIKPAWNLPLLALGVSQLESGDHAQAAGTFQKAIAVDPSDARGHFLYATALTKAGTQRAEAIAALRKAVALSPRDARSHALLGQLLLNAEDAPGAAREWQTALKVDPENPTALYQLGLLYRKQGKTEESRRLLETFQRLKAQ